ncbi:two-component system regulatory protein YycI [Oceanobacillus halotolerans]|uniref:two-component system regulatory protein YycI n=1 Tax=Oceanobacillus halotolerans TaxID=2663380 RepID=UPI0013D0665B|nr:two-component system regulatory protein YycI [Oceanobacillus halotolerans]
MQWGQIKTLFILCFLLLDIYLLLQYMEKQEQADIGVLEREESTIEEQLELEDITIEASMEEEAIEEYYISARPKPFTEEDLSELEDRDDITYTTIDGTILAAQLEDTIVIPPEGSEVFIRDIISSYVLHSDEYVYWGKNDNLNAYVFFQEKNDRPVYYNQNGMILVFFNEDNEMISYTQTMLGEADTRGDAKTLIEPIKAIETLYDTNEFYSGDTITTIDIGFHTRVPLENGVQVFAPTWKVTVNDTRNYFVNAIEGLSFSSQETIFLEEAVSNIISRLRTSEMDETLKNELILRLSSGLEEN